MDPYKTRTDEEINQLAEDARAGRVFGTWNLAPGDERMAFSIFMPAALAGPDFGEWLKENDIAHFYENMEKSGERSINDYPMFFSLKCLSKPDSQRLSEASERLNKLMEQFHTPAAPA